MRDIIYGCSLADVMGIVASRGKGRDGRKRRRTAMPTTVTKARKEGETDGGTDGRKEGAALVSLPPSFPPLVGPIFLLSSLPTTQVGQ